MEINKKPTNIQMTKYIRSCIKTRVVGIKKNHYKIDINNSRKGLISVAYINKKEFNKWLKKEEKRNERISNSRGNS